jgi:hypothetical protein
MPKLYAATSRDSLFVDSEWIEVPLGPSSIQAGASPQQTGIARVHLPINHPTAFVSLGEYVVGRHRFWLSEPATILKPDSLGTLFQKSLNSK